MLILIIAFYILSGAISKNGNESYFKLNNDTHFIRHLQTEQLNLKFIEFVYYHPK